MRAEFEWGIAQLPDGTWEVHERLTGTDLLNRYSVPSEAVAISVVKARRAFVHRTITSRTAAIQIFEPRPNLEALRLLQAKGHLDS
jgi:hypothetical protein